MSIKFGFEDKRIIVTGATRGLGRCIASSFVSAGAKVAGTARDVDQSLVRADGWAIGLEGDLSQPSIAAKVVSDAVDRLSGLDILICNVGNGSSAPPGQETFQDWEQSFNVNFFSAINTISTALRPLRESRGVVICISSICGQEVIKGAPLTYSVSKAALNAYVKCASHAFAQSGVRICGIAPGNIMFEGSTWDRKKKENPDGVIEMLETHVPLKRFASDREIAQQVLFLASESSAFTNGAILTSDGGQTRGL